MSVMDLLTVLGFTIGVFALGYAVGSSCKIRNDRPCPKSAVILIVTKG